MRAVPNAASEFYNCKRFSSITILAIVNDNYQFMQLYVGTNGAEGDAQICYDSHIKLGFSTGRLPMP